MVLTYSYQSMGSPWEITIWDDIAKSKFDDLCQEIVKRSQEFDQAYSRFIPDSLVSNIAKRAGEWQVPEDFARMLEMYFDLYELSDKKLNPLIGNTISDLGYDADYSLIPKNNIRPTPDLLVACRFIGRDPGAYKWARYTNTTYKILTTEPVLFDFGGLGKGYFVDKISQYLLENNIQKFLVNGSGDIYFYNNLDSEKIRAGLEHPNDDKKVIGVLEIQNGALCASGINRRKWGKYHHTIDPLTSSSVENDIIATWTFCEYLAQPLKTLTGTTFEHHPCALADALATCLFFVEPEKLKKQYLFEYCMMNQEGKIKFSEGFTAELY